MNFRFSPALASAVVSLLVYSVSLGGTFIFDDVAICRDDNRMTMPIKWSEIWTKPYWLDGVDNLYRPLVTFSYAVQRWVSGPRPFEYHIVNWLLAAAAVAALAMRVANARAGYIAGILFAVHPIHVEAVSWLVGRAEMMCLLPTIIALILFLHKPLTALRAVAIVFCEAIAVLSKA